MEMVKNSEKEHRHSESCGEHGCDESGKNEIIKLIAGVVVFCAALVISRLFAIHDYLELALFVAAYLILGGEIVLKAAKNILHGQVFDENFLMSTATIGAFAIGEYPEAVAVMLFYQIGEYFQDLAVSRSKKSITALMDIRPDYANVYIDGEVVNVDPATVNVGDLILVRPGEKIPLDGTVTEGESMLDMTALTGESVPKGVRVSDSVLSGCINLNGVLKIEVTKTFGESTVAKIIDLVENASSKKAPTEKFITRFARYYTPVVVGLAVLIAVLPPLLMGGAWSDWVNRGLIFLVISCPCALVISIPLGFFGGIGGASRKGILVKGGNYLEALSKIDTVVFDKTGTLTKGVFKVTKLLPANGFTEDELIAFAAQAEAYSNHPIALSIVAHAAQGSGIRGQGLGVRGQGSVDEGYEGYSEIAGHGVSVMVDGITILAGNSKLMSLMDIPILESPGVGTKVYVAKGGEYAGCIVISDEIKPDSYEAIPNLRSKGIRKIALLTGDDPKIAEAIAEELKLDEVYGGLLPDQKVDMIEEISKNTPTKGKLAFVGDGINDAPVLARADVGVAMGALGSDAAIEAADVVLMTDEPSKLAEAIGVAHFTNRIVRQNIVFALGIKVVFLLLGALGFATMWEAVFADVGVALLAILNAMRVGRMK